MFKPFLKFKILATLVLGATFLFVNPAGLFAETTTVSVTVFIAECSDGIDNDADGFTDYPNDPDCDDGADNSEETPPDPPSSGGGSDGGTFHETIYDTGQETKEEFPDGQLISFQGTGFPGQEITLLVDSTRLEQTTTSSDGGFQISIEGLEPGNYTFSLITTDRNGLSSAIVTFNVNLSDATAIYLSNIVFPPTLNVSPPNVSRGDNIQVSGETVPNSTVEVFLNKELSFSQKVEASGYFQYTIDTEDLIFGKHKLQGKSNLGGMESPMSRLHVFEVTEGRFPETQRVLIGDINNDNLVNLVDLSMLVYWYRREASPLEVDLTGDGKVDLSDISVLVSNWTG